MQIRGALLGCVVLCGLSLACEEEKPPAPAKPAPSAVAAPAPTPAAAPTPEAEKPAAKAGARPSKIDTELTAARRTQVEGKYAAAKGFLVVSDVQAKLKADKSLKDKKAAVAAFDKLARGKWLLFNGPLVNLKDDGFDMALEYTPQLPNDPMGMSRQFFEVSMSEVEGYTKEAFKDGNVGVVLVKYNGATKASPGYELVATGAWK
ncbi:MAG TPA: hypothetical protein VHB79_04735 [Polyangiaceae bacterium]|nr:hypothetical protein [Polyangiaceae bacterium]